MVNFPCSVCEKPVGINHEAVCCGKCNKWVHIRSSNLQISQERCKTMVLQALYPCWTLIF